MVYSIKEDFADEILMTSMLILSFLLDFALTSTLKQQFRTMSTAITTTYDVNSITIENSPQKLKEIRFVKKWTEMKAPVVAIKHNTMQ